MIEASVIEGAESLEELFMEERSRGPMSPYRPFPEQPIPPDTRRRILGTLAVPFLWVCKIEAPPGGIVGDGSGTLIRPNKVLTAAHVVSAHTANPGGIRVIPAKRSAGTSSSAEPRGHAFGARIDIASGYTNAPGADPFDYAVITLDRNISGSAWTRIRAVDDARLRNARVNIAGYPGDIGGAQQMIWSFNRIVSVSGNNMQYLNDTAAGMSGSPVWIRWRDARTLIGVHTDRDTPPAPIANQGVHITPSVLTEIQSWL